MQPTFSGLAVLCAIFVEITGFITVGTTIGILPTLALVMLSMFTGICLLRRQGYGILKHIQNKTNSGYTPDHEITRGAMVLTGAILLIIPGFFSDIIGILLFVPSVQKMLWKRISKRIVHSKFREKKYRKDVTIIDLDDSDYHSVETEKTLWRNPGNKE